MRAILIGTGLLSALAPVAADELDDLSALACAQASNDLEREVVGCPSEESDAPND